MKRFLTFAAMFILPGGFIYGIVKAVRWILSREEDAQTLDSRRRRAIAYAEKQDAEWAAALAYVPPPPSNGSPGPAATDAYKVPFGARR